MLAAIEETYPSDIAMTILKFCHHPTAELIKKSYRERITPGGTLNDGSQHGPRSVKRNL